MKIKKGYALAIPVGLLIGLFPSLYVAQSIDSLLLGTDCMTGAKVYTLSPNCLNSMPVVSWIIYVLLALIPTYAAARLNTEKAAKKSALLIGVVLSLIFLYGLGSSYYWDFEGRDVGFVLLNNPIYLSTLLGGALVALCYDSLIPKKKKTKK